MTKENKELCLIGQKYHNYYFHTVDVKNVNLKLESPELKYNFKITYEALDNKPASVLRSSTNVTVTDKLDRMH